MSPGHKRQIVESLVIAGRCSRRAACRHFGLHRSTFSYEAKEPDAWLARLKAALRRLSNQHAELGYAKITCSLKEEGWKVGTLFYVTLAYSRGNKPFPFAKIHKKLAGFSYTTYLINNPILVYISAGAMINEGDRTWSGKTFSALPG
jgi:hypothetical protein